MCDIERESESERERGGGDGTTLHDIASFVSNQLLVVIPVLTVATMPILTYTPQYIKQNCRIVLNFYHLPYSRKI